MSFTPAVIKALLERDYPLRRRFYYTVEELPSGRLSVAVRRHWWFGQEIVTTFRNDDNVIRTIRNVFDPLKEMEGGYWKS